MCNRTGNLFLLITMRIISFSPTERDDTGKGVMLELPMGTLLPVEFKTRPVQITDKLADFAWHDT